MYFERENNVSYMVIEKEDTSSKSYEMKMLEKNNIPRLLSLEIRNVNGKSVHYYDITSKQQLTKLYSYSGITWKDVRMICEGISLLSKDINEYMLNLEDVILSPEYIYADVSEEKIYFTYYENKDNSGDVKSKIKALFEYILERFEGNSDKEHLLKMYSVYQRVAQEDYDISNMCELLDKENMFENDMFEENTLDEDKGSDTVQEQKLTISEPKSEVKKIKIEAVKPEILDEEEEVENKSIGRAEGVVKAGAVVLMLFGLATMIVPGIFPFRIEKNISVLFLMAGGCIYVAAPKIFLRMRFGFETKKVKQDFEIETEPMNYEAAYEEYAVVKENEEDSCEKGTVLLSDYIKELNKKSELRLKLIPMDCDDDNEIIEIDRYPSVIGSMTGRCDKVVNSPLVSRMHICILKEKEGYCIEDLNTTNGTYVNNEKLYANIKHAIADGDEIKLATLCYKVEIS